VRCKECRDNLPQHSLGVLSEREQSRMREHLADCPDCRAELAAFERLDALIAPTEQMTPERDLWAGVARRMQPRRASLLDWLVPRWQPALAAAAVIMVLVVGGVMFSVQPPAVTTGSETLAADYQEQQVIAEWSQPLADDAALGLMLASIDVEEGEVW